MSKPKSIQTGDFAPAIKAKKIIAHYSYVVSWDEESECYMGEAMEFPPTVGCGETQEECLQTTKENLFHAIAYALECGEDVPLPLRALKRTAQVNIRMTPVEKRIIEEHAKAGGYHGVSDFMRETALAR